MEAMTVMTSACIVVFIICVVLIEIICSDYWWYSMIIGRYLLLMSIIDDDDWRMVSSGIENLLFRWPPVTVNYDVVCLRYYYCVYTVLLLFQ